MEVCVPVEFVWFDVGYTLLYKAREALFAEVLGESGILRSYDEIDRAFHAIDKRFMREFPGMLGRSSREYMPLYIGLLCRYLDIRGDVVAILNAWIDAWLARGLEWQAYPSVEPTLAALKGMGIRLGVISNWDRSLKSILERCGLLGYFEIVVVSSEVGYEKPDERIFRSALDSARIAPSRCLYVGDNYYDDKVGALSVGMECFIINRFGAFGVEELAGQTIIPDVSGILPRLAESRP